MENKQEWLDSLQIGDKVAMDIGSYGYSRYSIATITKVTPTRRITTSNGRVFNANGSEYGKGSNWGSGTYLEPVTNDIRERILRNKLISELKEINFEGLTTEQLLSIQSIVKKENEA